MKKILLFLILFTMPSLHAYILKFYNQTDYPLAAMITFDPGAPCKTIIVAIPPQLPNQLPIETNLTCCTASIKIQRTDNALNKIEYEVENKCGDTAINITQRSDNILEVR